MYHGTTYMVQSTMIHSQYTMVYFLMGYSISSIYLINDQLYYIYILGEIIRYTGSFDAAFTAAGLIQMVGSFAFVTIVLLLPKYGYTKLKPTC